MPGILKEFIDLSARSANFVDFDHVMAGMKQRLPERESGNASVEIAWKLYELARDHFYMTLVIDRKLVEIARGLENADKHENITVFMTLSRSFFEHAASLAYQNDVLQKTLEELAKDKEDEAINKHLAARHGKLKKLFYSNGKVGPKVHVNDMLEVVVKTRGHLADRYDDLCEFVHPNHGSNKLVAAGTLGKGKLLPANGVLNEERANAFVILGECIDLVNDCTVSIGKKLIQLHSRINIASLPTTRPDQIFLDRLGWSGDGKSRGTALTFVKARTHTEALMAFTSYVEKNGLVIDGREIFGFDQGFLFEKVSSQKGLLWVKYKLQD